MNGFGIIFLAYILLFGFFEIAYVSLFSSNDANNKLPQPLYKGGIRKFRFASYYQDHMVLQRSPHKSIIWGYGDLDAEVTAKLSNEEYVTKVEKGSDGFNTWKIILKPYVAGGPHTIYVTQQLRNGASTQTISIQDILFGEVWLCAGQSNMALRLSIANNSNFEIKESLKYENIRLMVTSQKESKMPLNDLVEISTSWSKPRKEFIGKFSAVCWLYGKYMHDVLSIPFGMIMAAKGSTSIASWTSGNAVRVCNLDTIVYKDKRRKTSVTYNAMIHPFTKMTIKGVVWYQGEGDTNFRPDDYKCLFPAMIADWRNTWNKETHGMTDKEFPIGFVQLETRNAPNWFDHGGFSTVRWHQTADYGYAPNKKLRNTFMAVSIDILDTKRPYNDVHLRYKQLVAQRLSLGARRYVYGENILSDGPFPDVVKSDYEKNILQVIYPTAQFLKLNNKTQNFQICCDPNNCLRDDRFKLRTWSNATVTDSDNHSVSIDLTPCGLQRVTAVRYAWTVSPCDLLSCQIYNVQGLPAAPFYRKVYR